MLRTGAVSFALLVSLGLTAQTASLSGATLTVQAGTSIRIDGALNWTIAADAQLVNDGLIDLETAGVLSEADGAPVTGSGFEMAVWQPAAPLQQAEPGGLGLSLTTDYSGGSLRVERGHLPRMAANGTMGIARWYRVSTPIPSIDPLEVELRYDLSELGATLPSALSLFSAFLLNGPWVPLITSGNIGAQTLAGSTQPAEVLITAFDLDAATSIASASTDHWVLRPTLINDFAIVEPSRGTHVSHYDVHDARGRVLATSGFAPVGGPVLIPMSGYASGVYLITLNGGAHRFKVVKP